MEAVTLRTPRLLLRPWREADLEPFARLNADPDVSRFAPAPLDRAQSDALARTIMDHFREHGWGFWAVEEPGGEPFLGFIGLNVARFPAPFTPCVETGWRLACSHWGRGLAPEGARTALAFAFGPLGLEEVVAFTAHANQPSMRVMEKLGMVRDPGGDFDHPDFPPGHPLRPHVLYRVRNPGCAEAGLPGGAGPGGLP
jgi:RimJ/RimL family protein N-acetyltransferase